MLSNGQFHKQDSFLWYKVYYDECHDCIDQWFQPHGIDTIQWFKLKTFFFEIPPPMKTFSKGPKVPNIMFGRDPMY